MLWWNYLPSLCLSKSDQTEDSLTIMWFLIYNISSHTTLVGLVVLEFCMWDFLKHTWSLYFLVFSYTSAVLSLQYSFPFGFLLLFSNLWSIPCVSFGEGLLLVHFKVRCELCEERDFPLKCQRMLLILITSTGNILKIHGNRENLICQYSFQLLQYQTKALV